MIVVMVHSVGTGTGIAAGVSVAASGKCAAGVGVAASGTCAAGVGVVAGDIVYVFPSLTVYFMSLNIIYNHTFPENLISTIPHPRRIYRHTYIPRKQKIAPNNDSYYHR